MRSKSIFKYLSISLILILLVTNLYVLKLLGNEKKNTSDTVYFNSLLISKKTATLDCFFKTSLSNNNIKLKSPENELFRKDLMKGVTLVVRFSELNCGECVNSILFKTQKLFKNKNIRVILLTSYSSMNSSKIIRKQFKLSNIPAYNIVKLNLPVEECGYPYCFTIDSTFKVSNVFVPDRNVPSLTSTYFSMIENRYFVNRSSPY